ncbi:LacI family transcriptional regulator [Irregularibacter muris]|uniref:LacI family transcriptional regulator n=1 Tax=Irregularibacter muris TaxID=1796619 RepID=A0AAE3HI76_9FIRM|nr:LacI family DNA-binding transcriptional regulator [Irregularibacter muris]MCR1899404.1 LacI family transcriptional regulator [Irregularibacter muris]
MTTLKDIAKEVGVSVSTVSRVLNMKYSNAASKETQDRIWEVVRKTNYKPNIYARCLKKGADLDMPSKGPKSIYCIYARSSAPTENPFFSEVAHSIEYECYQNNCFVKYLFLGYDLSNPQISKQISDIKADGIVIIGRYDEKLLESFLKNHKHVVYTGLNKIDTKYDQIICDGYEAACMAVDYLYGLGHRKIAYIGEEENETRFLGYKDSLHRLGLSYNKEIVTNIRQSFDGGYMGAKKLINRSNNFSAVFCANDITATGALRAFKECALKIPEDISIISVDDIEMSQYTSPMLTTVHIPTDELGKVATRILFERIANGPHLPLKIMLPFHLIKRESCGKPSDKFK